MWVLLSAFPELTEDGEMLEIVGCFLDIRYVVLCAGHMSRLTGATSQQKWSEKLQAIQAGNARESKR